MSSSIKSTPHGIFYTGPMAAGKSSHLYTIANEYIAGGNDVLLLLPGHVLGLDFSPKTTRDRIDFSGEFASIDQNSCLKDLPQFNEDYLSGRDVICIDEMQFFSASLIVSIISYCQINGITLLASGLDTDFRQEYFPSYLLSKAHFKEVITLRANCADCGAIDKAVYSVLRSGTSISCSTTCRGSVLLDVRDKSDSTSIRSVDPTESLYKSVCKPCLTK
jgi:thymidine kinase